ncbi:MAG: radical SAM protein [Lachnospiraceae bacterium]|nr:radical SAM protein [Lachnospiraceae bacterium]
MNDNKLNRQLFVIWVTHNCNLRCSYCYENKSNNCMDDATADRVIRFIIEYVTEHTINVCDIHFHGGEPLLKYNIIDKIRRGIMVVDGCKFNCSITTNATLLTPEIASELENNFDTVSISIDGKPEIHDRYRKTADGNGSFNKALRGVSYFENINKLRIRMTVTKENVCELYNNIKFLSELGFIWIDPGIDLFAKWDEETTKILEDNLKRVYRYYQDKPYMNKFDAINPIFYNMQGCEGGKKTIQIDYDGALYPCSFVVGKLNMKIGTIWDGIDHNIVNKIHEHNKNLLIQCTGCNMQAYCVATNCRILQSHILNDNKIVLPILCRMQNLKYSFWKNTIASERTIYED